MENSDGELIEIKRHPGLFTNWYKFISAVAIMYKETSNLEFFHNPNSINPLVNEKIIEKFNVHYYANIYKNGLKWE